MKIVILGGGKVGYETAKALSLNENDVSVVDSSAEVIDLISEKLDVRTVLGSASDINVLIEAGLPSADILIAATSSDEVNIVACQLADFLFQTETKIARISRKSYFDNGEIFSKDNFPIDLAVSPEFEIAYVIKRSISIPGALDVVSCANDKVRIIGVVCKKYSAVANMQLKYLPSITKGFDIAILYIDRNDETILPSKFDIIKPGDEVYFAVQLKDLQSAMSLFGYENNESSNVVIIGGSEICQEIVEAITFNDSDIKIKIIEKNITRAETLSEKLNDVDVLHGDALDIEVLEAAQIGDTDIVISMTNDDKTNILSCLLSKKFGAKRGAAVLNDASYSKLLYSLGINTILDSRHAVVTKILHYIKKGGLETIAAFGGDAVEILLIDVYNNSHAIGILTDDIFSKNEILVAALIRGEQVFMLPRKMLISFGDKVLLIVKKNLAEKVLKIFQEKPKYLA